MGSGFNSKVLKITNMKNALKFEKLRDIFCFNFNTDVKFSQLLLPTKIPGKIINQVS
jgi:hypothetical protein